ncbi:MAG: hypothetical protein R3F56_06205 [Planctomycetota bacterium]
MILTSLCVLLLTQDPLVPAPAMTPTPSPTPLAGPDGSVLLDLPIPIHTHDLQAGAEPYGWWAGGPGYKASFHDGFVFYPRQRRAQAPHTPLRWTTMSITCGGLPIVDPTRAPSHHRAAWRYEYRWPGITEAYDVRKDGVEQTFVVAARPLAAGDLVVTGRVATSLVAHAGSSGAAAQQDVVFDDDAGEGLVRYSAAFAVDANGRRTAVATTRREDEIALTVPAAWLATATFPVTVDPLTSRIGLTGGIVDLGNSLIAADVGCDQESSTANLMCVFSWPSSGFDSDVFAVLYDHDFTNPRVVYSDLSLARAQRPNVGFVAGADRWVLAYESNPGLVVYLHDKGNVVPDSGTRLSVTPGVGQAFFAADVGGTAGGSGGDNALVTFQSRQGTNVNNDAILGLLVNARARTAGAPFAISATGGNLDSEWAAVNSESDGGSASWIVTYAQKDNAVTGDDYDLLAARVTANGTVAGTAQLGPAVGSAQRFLAARLAGRGGRYLVSILESLSSTSGTDRLWVQRFDWPESAVAPTPGASRVLASWNGFAMSNPSVAFDGDTRSHWVVAYSVRTASGPLGQVVRLGHSGGVVETNAFPPSGAIYQIEPAGIAFDPVHRAYPLQFLTTASNTALTVVLGLFGQRYLYPADALSIVYGTGCGLGVNGTPHPLAGNEFYEVVLGGLPAGTACVLLLSTGQAALPLDGLGMTACVLNVDPNRLVVSLPTAVAGNAARVRLPLPDDPPFLGDLYTQWAFAQPGLNRANLGATLGARMQVR